MNRNLSQFTNQTCHCGQRHSMLTQEIIIGTSAFDSVGEAIIKYGLPSDALVVYDQNTYRATQGRVSASLKKYGFKISEYVFKVGVHADETGVGLLMLAAARRPKMLVGVGSGTISDLCRFCAYQMNIPFVICATAPSMDGYASTVAAMTMAGIKTSFTATHPHLIFGETEVLRQAPLDMIAAGFGDIAGKVSALMDWEMGRRVIGEPYCQSIADLTSQTVDTCFKAGAALARRDDAAIVNLMQALTTSGIAMQLNGNSRPASGAEHHISHFLEMTDQETHRAGAYHGAKVGMASLITLRLYEKLFLGGLPALKAKPTEQAVKAGIHSAYGDLADGLLSQVKSIYMDEQAMLRAIKDDMPHMQEKVASFAEVRAEIETILRACGGPVKPQDLGYSREVMRNAIIYSRFIRERFTILTLLDNWGLLAQYADEVLDEIF